MVRNLGYPLPGGTQASVHLHGVRWHDTGSATCTSLLPDPSFRTRVGGLLHDELQNFGKALEPNGPREVLDRLLCRIFDKMYKINCPDGSATPTNSEPTGIGSPETAPAPATAPAPGQDGDTIWDGGVPENAERGCCLGGEHDGALPPLDSSTQSLEQSIEALHPSEETELDGQSHQPWEFLGPDDGGRSPTLGDIDLSPSVFLESWILPKEDDGDRYDQDDLFS